MKKYMLVLPLAGVLFLLSACGQGFKENPTKVNQITPKNASGDKGPADLGITRNNNGIDIYGDQFKLTISNPQVSTLPNVTMGASNDLTTQQYQTSANFELKTNAGTDQFALKTLENRKIDNAWTGAADAKALQNYSAILITRCADDDCTAVYGLLQLAIMKNASEFLDIRECGFKILSAEDKLEPVVCLGRGEKFGTMNELITKYNQINFAP